MVLPLACVLLYLVYLAIKLLATKFMKLEVEGIEQHDDEHEDLLDYCQFPSLRSNLAAEAVSGYNTFQ